MKHTVLCRLVCVCMLAMTICLSGCGSEGNENDNVVMQASGEKTVVTVIEREFIGADVGTPEYIEGVKLIGENGNSGIKLKDFGEASIYSYTIDPEYTSIENKIEADDVVSTYVDDLEKKFGVKFNKSSEYDFDVYYGTLATDTGNVGVAVGGGDFDGKFGAAISVAVQLPESNRKTTSSGGNSSDKTSKVSDGTDISGCWQAVYYLADNGNTVNTDTYSIYVYNTGSTSIYIDSERYEGTWKTKDNGFEFSFSGLNGYGEMAKIKNREYLLVKFDGAEGRIAFDKIY